MNGGFASPGVAEVWGSIVLLLEDLPVLIGYAMVALASDVTHRQEQQEDDEEMQALHR
ncbi:MAG TPA: hypothetical protein VMV94_15695 [Phycisphaerae bacterium]|nr:hypothetical protein [Phycisphaerae bacterium]